MIMTIEEKCDKYTVTELFDYVNGRLKDDKERSSAIERHALEKNGSKGCKDCFKHIASLNGASETLINII